MRPLVERESARQAGGGWRRYAGIYAMLWRNSLVREMTFKVNFLLWIAVELAWFALQLTFIGVMYLHTESIAGWSRWEVVLLMGASHFIQQVFQALFLVNCTHLSELVRTGKLDFLLMLPVNTRFVVSMRQVDLGACVNAATAVGVMIYAGSRLGLAPTAAQIAGFLLLCVGGIAIHYSLMFLLATISFWTVQAQGIVWAYYNLFNIARLPDAVFRGMFKVVFTFAVPMLLVSNVPVKLLAAKLSSPLEMGDQFTSQPEYWNDVEKIVGDAPSTLNLTFPEVYLEKPGGEERIGNIQATMRKYMDEDILQPHDGLVYVERTIDGKSRKGIVLAQDLEAYDYNKGSSSLVRATEGTIVDRLPPRIKIREGSTIELPHILVLIDGRIAP